MSIIIKTEEEIEGIRKSCKLAAKILDWVEQFVLPGATTSKIDEQISDYIEAHGATAAPLGYMGFPKSVCTSINEVICHGIPDERKLKNGDIINIDVTTILDGYYGDTSRMYVVGEVGPEIAKLLDVTKKSLEIGIEQVKPGNYFGNIGYEIAKFVEPQGYSLVEMFCGHGVGVQFHEDPKIPHKVPKPNLGPLMTPGMTFTIEPMVNVGRPEGVIDREDKWTARTIDGALSAQYEHTLLVTEDGVEILTQLN